MVEAHCFQHIAVYSNPQSDIWSCPQDNILHTRCLGKLHLWGLLNALEVLLKVCEQVCKHALELVQATVEVACSQRLQESPAKCTLHCTLDGEFCTPLLVLATREAVQQATGKSACVENPWRMLYRHHRQLQEAGPAN